MYRGQTARPRGLRTAPLLGKPLDFHALRHPMKFALLGDDPESRALANAAAAAGHEIGWHDVSEDPLPGGAWEALFDPATADAILVGAGPPDLRARQVQELAKQGRPLLVVHPIGPSVISYFEIDMARTESGAIVEHFNPLIEAECAPQLAAWVRDGHPELGAVEQIAATRHLADRAPDRVLWHFARDVELLTRIAGRLDRIGAHAALGQGDAAYGSLSVQLLGRRPVPVRWAVEPPAGQAQLRVALICKHGRATLEFDAEGRAVELVIHQGDAESRSPQGGASPAAIAVSRFVSIVNEGNAVASTWPDALDAMELADSIEISLRRGRMIDVHHRELTEQLAFKGVMSALGCGVLVVLIPLAIVIGWLAGLLGIPLSQYWAHALLALLAAFLALQFLPRMFAQKPVVPPPADELGPPE
jgi:hypothetical protein